LGLGSVVDYKGVVLLGHYLVQDLFNLFLCVSRFVLLGIEVVLHDFGLLSLSIQMHALDLQREASLLHLLVHWRHAFQDFILRRLFATQDRTTHFIIQGLLFNCQGLSKEIALEE
jgi:hypothetical protein